MSVGERTASLLDRRSLGRWRGQGGDGRDGWQTGSHLAVMDDQDLYVSTVLSLGGQFGSRTFSQGFLLNNALASFDLSQLLAEGGETASSNLLSEGRRPLSRMAPVVAVSADTCGLRILTGGALVEVTAQVLAPVLLSPNGDMNRALRTPKLVMVNGTARAEPGLNPAVVSPQAAPRPQGQSVLPPGAAAEPERDGGQPPAGLQPHLGPGEGPEQGDRLHRPQVRPGTLCRI